MELEDVIVFLHWLDSRLKSLLTRHVLLGRHFGDRAEGRRWLADWTIVLRREGMVIELLDLWLGLTHLRIADPSLIQV